MPAIRTLAQFVLLVLFACNVHAGTTAGMHAGIDLASFDTVLHIQPRGAVVVVEHFAPAEPRSHIVWSTATEYPGAWSIHSPRVLDIYQVTTAEGKPLHYTSRNRKGRLELDIDTAGVSEVRLVYAVLNAVEFHRDQDRFLWTPGQGWRGDAKNVTVFVQVPPELAGNFNAQAFLRGHGLLPARESSAGPDRLWFEMDSVGANEPLHIDVALPPGILQQRSVLQRLVWFVSDNTIVLLPLIVLAIMLVLRRIKTIPEDDSIGIVPRYEPPAGLTPAEVGVLIDDRLDPRDITATLIDLAVRKYVRLEQGTPDEGIHFDRQDFVLRLLRPMAQWSELQPHEQSVLFNTFYGGEWTKLSSLTLRFYSVVPGLRAQLNLELRHKGFYWIDPQKAPWLRLANLGILLVVLFVLQMTGVVFFAASWLLSLVAVTAAALIVHFMGRRLTAKTRKGMRAYREILGLREFLDAVDHDRLERLPADLFERCLPYAIALGVEHHWANAFSGIAMGPPDWFQVAAPELFNTARLGRVLDLFSRQTAVTLSTAPRGSKTAKPRTLAQAVDSSSGPAVSTATAKT